MTDNDRETDRFESAFRKWASRAPSTSSSDGARHVVARVGSTGRLTLAGVWAQRLAVACGLVLVAASGVLIWRSQTPPAAPTATAEATPMLPDNVVIFWLDAETPVYFVVGPMSDDAGGTP